MQLFYPVINLNQAVPLLVATDIEEGRVVGCGSYEMFRDKVTGGITFGDNEKLLLILWII